jgi:hypothetical protein
VLLKKIPNENEQNIPSEIVSMREASEEEKERERLMAKMLDQNWLFH